MTVMAHGVRFQTTLHIFVYNVRNASYYISELQISWILEYAKCESK